MNGRPKDLVFTERPYATRHINRRGSAEHMTRVILYGSFAVTILLIPLLVFSWVGLKHPYASEKIVTGLGVAIYLAIVSLFVHKNHTRLAAWLLVILYCLVGILIMHTWGINAPIGVLILGFSIFLSSVMLGTKYIPVVTLGIIGTLVLLQYLNIIGISRPSYLDLGDRSSFGDVIGYSISFVVFAVIAWLSGAKMENALKRAVEAEESLQKERDRLVVRVEEQTKNIMRAQQKELKQLYKFAELGQLTTIILHELANYLSVLTLDIEDIKDRHYSSVAIENAKESMFYIDTIIDQVRNQISDSDFSQKFDALTTVKASIAQLKAKLKNSNIKLFVEDEKSKNYMAFGDPLRLSQAIIILVTNAVQASSNKQSEIAIDFGSLRSNILISVKDFGTGITQEARRTLFQPQKSKKGSGLGIGLYITKQIIDTHFKGKIWLSPATEYTQFNIEIPRRGQPKN